MSSKAESAQFEKEYGCILGLALGDALCAPYEGGLLERLLWYFLGKTKDGKKRWTDDTQMCLDSMRSLMQHKGIDQDHLATCFAQSYRWSRGYGPAAARLLKNIKRGKHWSTLNCAQYAQGSFGNGAAMRVPVLSVFFRHNKSALAQAITDASVITHAHPQAVTGAQIVGHVVLAALQASSQELDLLSVAADVAAEIPDAQNYREKIQAARDMQPQASVKEIVKALGNGMAAFNSAITAVYVAQRYQTQPYLDMIKMIQSMGGDTDTIAAMVGSIWGASNGFAALPQDLLAEIESSVDIIDKTMQLCLLRDGI